MPLGVPGRESGGVAGTSPAAFAIATTERTISFMAVSRDMVRTSRSSSFGGGDGASWRLRLPNSGNTPASPAGFGAEGGSMSLVKVDKTGASTRCLGCTVFSGGLEKHTWIIWTRVELLAEVYRVSSERNMVVWEVEDVGFSVAAMA